MFCFQTPFGKRDRNTPICKILISESEKNLNKISYNPQCLCLSDSNLSESYVNSEFKKWERWRINAQIGLDLSIKNKNKTQKNKISNMKANEDFCQVLTKNLIFNENCTSVGNLESSKANDIEFIDEITESKDEDKSTSNEEVIELLGNGEENDFSGNKSIINVEAIRINPLEPCSDNITRSKSELNICNAQVIAHVRSDTDVRPTKNQTKSSKELEISKCDDGRSLKQQFQTNSGSSFLSFCSLFHSSKSPTETPKNNKIKYKERNTHIVIQQNLGNLACCSLSGVQQRPNSPNSEVNQPVENIVIINKSPKSKNASVFQNVKCKLFECERNVSWSSSGSSLSSSDNIAPIASPEVVSPYGSVTSSPKLNGFSTSEGAQELQCHFPEYQTQLFSSPFSIEHVVPLTKFKLMHEGDVQVCYLNHTRTIINKVLSSKLLRRWETHRIYLADDCLYSKTPIGFLETPVPYSNLDEVYVVGRWDQGNRFCIRLVMAEGSLLLQTSNSLVRDQWLSSIIWKRNMYKYRNILQKSTRPEVILKEIKALIHSSLNAPIQDDCITTVPIDIISKLLLEDEIWKDRQRREEVIMALGPLLEDSNPSAEMFRFFSRHCLCHPRSPVVVDVFTPIVHRILKRTVDFSKFPLMRRFVADYLKALHLQNDGDEAIRKFAASIHGSSSGCPHPRVLPNLVAVNLAAVFSHFEQRKTLMAELTNDANCEEALQVLDKQLQCFITLFLAIVDLEDWRPGLAQLLQPIPFPDDALSHEVFIKGFTPVIKKIGIDPRCDVHGMVLGIRENKEGWLNVFCPSSLVCKDEGLLWCQMLHTLFYCCCKRKSFLQKMVKHLGALLLVALRDYSVAQEVLCLMLEWHLIPGEDQEMQVVTTLQSTETGRQKYSELCKRQENLRELQKEGGPKKLTLPSRSTDADVARLLSCGSFGNLECLSLAFTHVTSACAHHLIKLPSIRYLNLWATQFGDAGLMVIADHLDKLQVLNLCETPVSDKGISAIAGLKSLRKLNLNSTKLSPQTLDTLKQKLPALQEIDVRYTDAW